MSPFHCRATALPRLRPAMRPPPPRAAAPGPLRDQRFILPTKQTPSTPQTKMSPGLFFRMRSLQDFEVAMTLKIFSNGDDGPKSRRPPDAVIENYKQARERIGSPDVSARPLPRCDVPQPEKTQERIGSPGVSARRLP